MNNFRIDVCIFGHFNDETHGEHALLMHKVKLTRNCGNRREWSFDWLLFGWLLFTFCWSCWGWWGTSLLWFITVGFIVPYKILFFLRNTFLQLYLALLVIALWRFLFYFIWVELRMTNFFTNKILYSNISPCVRLESGVSGNE